MLLSSETLMGFSKYKQLAGYNFVCNFQLLKWIVLFRYSFKDTILIWKAVLSCEDASILFNQTLKVPKIKIAN